MVIRETNYSVTVSNAIFNLKRTKIIDSRKILQLINSTKRCTSKTTYTTQPIKQTQRSCESPNLKVALLHAHKSDSEEDKHKLKQAVITCEKALRVSSSCAVALIDTLFPQESDLGDWGAGTGRLYVYSESVSQCQYNGAYKAKTLRPLLANLTNLSSKRRHYFY